jgi:hypothetical protein
MRRLPPVITFIGTVIATLLVVIATLEKPFTSTNMILLAILLLIFVKDEAP